MPPKAPSESVDGGSGGAPGDCSWITGGGVMDAPPPASALDVASVVGELRCAVREVSARGLYDAASWLAELLDSCIQNLESDKKEAAPQSKIQNDFFCNDDFAMLAKTYFDMREYRRCSFHAEKSSSSYGVFLRYYSLYLHGEKQKENLEGLNAPSQRKAGIVAENEEVAEIVRALSELHKGDQLDAFGLYLYGMCLRSRNENKKARAVLVESVNRFPWNWSAWKCLVSLCHDKDTVMRLPLKQHWMLTFAYTDFMLQLELRAEEVRPHLDVLLRDFPRSPHTLTQDALLNYNELEYDASESTFEALRKIDPYRLDGLDSYASILYVKRNSEQLNCLAHETMMLDKYRPETMFIAAQFHVSRCESKLALVYYQRALRLNPKYVSALVLMGHEYLELKNHDAAIHCYRQATEISPKDHRPWFGLGLAYELSEMYAYALYYYKKAAQFRPEDARMWNSMGACYEHLQRNEEAIKCYLKAEGVGDNEAIAMNRLAELYRRNGQRDQAFHYYEQVVSRHTDMHGSGGQPDGGNASIFGAREPSADSLLQGKGADSDDAQSVLNTHVNKPLPTESVVVALLFMADYCMQSNNWIKCEEHCDRLMMVGGRFREEAKSILQQCRQNRQQWEKMQGRQSSFSVSLVQQTAPTANAPSTSVSATSSSSQGGAQSKTKTPGRAQPFGGREKTPQTPAFLDRDGFAVPALRSAPRPSRSPPNSMSRIHTRSQTSPSTSSSQGDSDTDMASTGSNPPSTPPSSGSRPMHFTPE